MANVSVKKEKNQNIQVFVRLRPINSRERDIKSLGVVEVSGNKDVLVKQHVLDAKHSKKFTFDRAFGPNSKQVDVYQEVVSPLIEEVLAGYNCTVFAYGQTGTGKTHTMVGESSGDADIPWQNDPMSGIIPRSLSQLFDELRITNAEYTVRVSYLELYNEELFDLLSSSEDNSKLRIYEDATRKGSNIVNGLEEMTVYNKNEVYKIMAKGQEKRRIASTLMNAQSSRSHTVFTIIVHMKENSPEGEELMKVGKLNLVDLAGSENISKAGSDNPSRKERARECVNINQSLLTLGRVITCLVERHPHIPYRESKLTRLLQESLGGRTKTSIIATISPGHRDVEETLSTLEYAYRARNIQNKPEINQKMTKIAVLKDYSEQIDRLKRDLQASRERNGIFLAQESYNEIQLKIEEQNKEIQEQILYIKAMKEEKERIEGLFNEMSLNLKNTEDQLCVTNKNLDQTKIALDNKKQELAKVEKVADEQKYLVSIQVETEKKLTNQAKNLLGISEQTTTDIGFLHNTVEKKKALENNNLNVMKTYSDKSQSIRMQIKDYMSDFTNAHIVDLSSLQHYIEQHHNDHLNNQITLKLVIDEMFENIREYLSTSEINKLSYNTKMNIHSDEVLISLINCTKSEETKMNEKMHTLLTLLAKLDIARENDKQSMEQMKQYVQQWKDVSTAKMVSLRQAHTAWWDSINDHMKNLMDQHKVNGDDAMENNKKMADLQQQYHEEVNLDMNKLKALISSMEEKQSKHKNMLDSMGEKNAKNFNESHSRLTTILHTVNEDAESKIQNVNNIVNNFDELNQTSINDITVMMADYKARVDLGKSIDVEIKHSQIEIADATEMNLTTNLKNTSDAINKIKSVHEEIISDQQGLYNSLLTKCCIKSDEIIHPIESTMKNITELKINNYEQLKRLESNVANFRDKMTIDIETNDKMESQLLNHDYKLYSPTGKTPIRREYAYPKYLVSTSPHDTLLSRYRNLKKSNFSDTSSPNQNGSIINLDPSIELTPMKRTSDKYQNDCSDGHLQLNVSDDSIIFLEPKSVKDVPFNGNSISKTHSESDIYTLADSKHYKENFDGPTSDKKDATSRLKQPLPVKKILGNKNN